MKVCALSDIHGNLNFNIEPCDVLCICGDIVPLYYQKSNKLSKDWLIEEFIPWCNNQPVSEILLIGGNHDFYLERHPEAVKSIIRDFEGLRPRITYLQDESYEYIDEESGKVFTFYGTPWCHKFGNWAFMLENDENLVKIFDNIPEGVDVLLTHDAPYGVSDVCQQRITWVSHNHIGCVPLADAIERAKPKMCLHGHLHTTNHEKEMLGDTEVYNVSLLDELYSMSYKPFYFEL